MYSYTHINLTTLAIHELPGHFSSTPIDYTVQRRERKRIQTGTVTPAHGDNVWGFGSNEQAEEAPLSRSGVGGRSRLTRMRKSPTRTTGPANICDRVWLSPETKKNKQKKSPISGEKRLVSERRDGKLIFKVAVFMVPP